MSSPLTQLKPSIAALIGEYGGADQFRLEETQIAAPGPEEIRVRVAATAVNPVDIKLRQGYLHAYMPLSFPACLGCDLSGVVESIGENVSGFLPGDLVMGMLTHGAYSQWVVAPANRFTILPEGLDLIEAAALPTGVMTGVQLVEQGIKPRAGEKVMVAGSGGSVGRSAVFAALDAGAIVYAGVRTSGLAAVSDLPVAAVIDLSDDEALQASGPFDCVADTVGGTVAEKLFSYLSPNGRFASVVLPAPPCPVGASQYFTSVIVDFDEARLQRFAREMIEKGRKMPIAQILGLADVARAHTMLSQGGLHGKVVLKMEPVLSS